MKIQNQKKYKVYKYTSPSGKIYIGQTCRDLKKRAGSNGIGYRKSVHFYNAITKYGWKSFTVQIMANGLTLKEADWLEQYLISYYHSNESEYGYNISAGGKGVKGHMSEEQKLHISAATKGRVKSELERKRLLEAFKGRSVSKESVEKRANSNRGKKRSEEQRKHISEGLKGRKLSPEHVEKYRQRMLGIKMSESSKQKNRESNKYTNCKATECVETGVIYYSAKDAARQIGGNKTGISTAIKNNSLYKGYHWRYITNTLS